MLAPYCPARLLASLSLLVLLAVSAGCGLQGEASGGKLAPETDAAAAVDAGADGDDVALLDAARDADLDVARDAAPDTASDVQIEPDAAPDTSPDVAPDTGSGGSGGSGGAVGRLLFDTPCAGCYTYASTAANSGDPIPLVVALHGDEGNAGLISNTFQSPAESRGMVLLALNCPRDMGCEGSWWRWKTGRAGERRRWLDAQIDKAAASYNIDLNRVYLTGWSGGATYMAEYAPRRTDRFAAFVFIAGGDYVNANCRSCKTPVKLIVGENDGLKPLVRRTRNFFQNCNHPVDYQELAGKGHNLAPWLQGGAANDVLDWMLGQSTTCGSW